MLPMRVNQVTRIVEDVEIKAARGGVSIIGKQKPEGDPYPAYGRIVQDRQISGEWRAGLDNGDAQGLFILTVNARGNLGSGEDPCC